MLGSHPRRDERLEDYVYQFEQLSDASVLSLMSGEFDISSESPPEERIKPLESVELYIFDSLIGYQVPSDTVVTQVAR